MINKFKSYMEQYMDELSPIYKQILEYSELEDEDLVYLSEVDDISCFNSDYPFYYDTDIEDFSKKSGIFSNHQFRNMTNLEHRRVFLIHSLLIMANEFTSRLP